MKAQQKNNLIKIVRSNCKNESDDEIHEIKILKNKNAIKKMIFKATLDV